MPKKKRRVLRPGETSYARNIDGDVKGDWSLDRVEETEDEPCEICDTKVSQIYCLSHNEEFEEKRACYDCAHGIVDDPKRMDEIAEDLLTIGSVATAEARFEALWEGTKWGRTTTQGNRCRTVGGIYIIVFRHNKGENIGEWGFKVGGDWGDRRFPTMDGAQRAAYKKARAYFRERQVDSVQAAQRPKRQERLWENGTPHGRPAGQRIHGTADDGLSETIRRAFGLPPRGEGDSEDLSP